MPKKINVYVDDLRFKRLSKRICDSQKFLRSNPAARGERYSYFFFRS
ncbi:MULTISPECIES: hypothetical protein [Bacillus]|nr:MULTISPECIES: hypothetical protein [Bacillus]